MWGDAFHFFEHLVANSCYAGSDSGCRVESVPLFCVVGW